MRYESCLTCQCPGSLADDGQRTMLVVSESLGPLSHHHHIVTCGLCGGWWFDDLVRGAFGIMPARRDTQMCDCPDGQPVYTPVAVTVYEADTSCACTKNSIDANPVQVKLMPEDIPAS